MQRNLAQQNLAQQQVRDALCENLAEAGVAVELISWGDGDHPAFQGASVICLPEYDQPLVYYA